MKKKMKKNVFFYLFAFLFLFSCSNQNPSVDEIVKEIDNTDARVEVVDFPCASVEYSFDGEEVIMIFAHTGMGDGGTDTKYYLKDNKLVYCYINSFYMVVNETNSEQIEMEEVVDEYTFYFENGTCTKSTKNNEVIDIDKNDFTPQELIDDAIKILELYGDTENEYFCG